MTIIKPLPASPWRFAPAFFIPVVIFAHSWLFNPPQLWPDTGFGLLAWRNFVAGGAWNTISEPSSANLSLNVEHVVTWWSPGQYVPLGVLTSLGLPLGTAMLVLALISAWSLTAGLVRLARAMDSPEATLPWVAVAAAGSWHTLFAFDTFAGGEIALIAVFPWLVLLAWRLRDQPIRQILLLPPLLLAGSFAKHSFGVYALGLLLFLWFEAVRINPRSFRTWTVAALAPARVGVLYAVGHHLLVPDGPNPASFDQIHHTVTESLGFAFNGPVLAATGAGRLINYFFMRAGLFLETGWQRYAVVFALLAPVSITLHVSLALASRPLLRLAGIMALLAGAALAFLYWRGAFISLDDRHFRPAGVLLLAAVASLTITPRLSTRLLVRALLTLIVIFGVGSALQRRHFTGPMVYPTEQRTAIKRFPPAAQAELKRIDLALAGGDAIIYLPLAELSPLVRRARLIVTDIFYSDGIQRKEGPRRGRVSSLVLVLPAGFGHDQRGQTLRDSFLDYPATAWSCRTIAGWDFWQTAPKS